MPLRRVPRPDPAPQSTPPATQRRQARPAARRCWNRLRRRSRRRADHQQRDHRGCPSAEGSRAWTAKDGRPTAARLLRRRAQHGFDQGRRDRLGQDRIVCGAHDQGCWRSLRTVPRASGSAARCARRQPRLRRRARHPRTQPGGPIQAIHASPLPIVRSRETAALPRCPDAPKGHAGPAAPGPAGSSPFPRAIPGSLRRRHNSAPPRRPAR